MLSIGVLAAAMLGGSEGLAHLSDHRPHHLPDLLHQQCHVYQVILVTGDFGGILLLTTNGKQVVISNLYSMI